MGCTATTNAGNPCKANAIKGTNRCISHSDKEFQASLGFSGEAGKLGGRPRRPREVEIFQKVAEEKENDFRAAIEEALTADRGVVVGNGPSAHVEMMPDHAIRLKAVEMITDRLHGKPRQSTEISGPEGGPVEFAGLPSTDEWHAQVADALKTSGALDASTDQDQ